ncbi:hypothetical protein IKJ53_00290, partial [bacterium]|nr:hypothetical protein [bacterium]
MFRVLKTIITLLFIFELACTKVCANEFGVLSPTLTTLYTQLSTFVDSNTSSYQLDTLPQTPTDIEISIFNETYYVTPNSQSDAKILELLSIYSSNELIKVELAEDALFTYEDTNGDFHYYSYNTNKMKKSVYELIDSSESDFDFFVSYFDSVDEIKKKYYKLNLLSVYISNHGQLITSNSTQDNNTIVVELPNNKVYLRYDYVLPENYITTSERLNTDNDSFDVENFLFKDVKTLNTNGGAILNTSKAQLVIKSDFVNNRTENHSGGAIYNAGSATVDGVFLDNIAIGTNISGGAISNVSIMSINSDFIKNSVEGINVCGGAISNIADNFLEKDAIIDFI